MARTFPAALAFVVAFTGSSLPAVAAPTQPATAPLVQTTSPAAASLPAAPADPGSQWSIPLTGVSAAAQRSAPAFTPDHDDDGHDHGVLSRGAGTGAETPEGSLAALSPAASTSEFTLAAVS